jgi:hypothetical protein
VVYGGGRREIMLIEDDGLNGFWNEVEEPMPRNLLGFNDNFLEVGEEDMEDSAQRKG